MAVLDSASAGRGDRNDRIELAVQRELARRRRLMTLYVLLLLIPLGVGGWLIAAGHLDESVMQQTVWREVETRVAPVEQHYQEIAPKLQQVQDLDKVLPEVKSAARQVDAQRIQVEKLAHGQEQLQQQVSNVASGVEKLAPQIQQIQERSMRAPENAEAHRGLDARLGALERNVNDLRQTQVGLMEQQKRIVVNLETLQREKPSPSASAIDLEKLNARLNALEKSHEQIKGQVFKLRPMEKPPQ